MFQIVVMDPKTRREISAVINKAIDLAKTQRVDDHRQIPTYELLLEEEKYYRERLNAIRVSMKPIPLDDMSYVMEIKNEMKSMLEKIQDEFQDQEHINVGKLDNAKRVKNGLRWVLKSYRSMQDLVSLIRTLNAVLNHIEPSLPQYSERGTTSTTLPRPTDASNVVTECITDGSENTANLLPTSSSDVLKTLFDTCLNGINMIESIKNESGEWTQNQGYRLRLWGSGLFDDALPLKELFNNAKDYTKPLYDFLLEAFVDIAITEGYF